MIFKRRIHDEIKEWKELDDGRTALLIEGARRVGKTTAAIEFAKAEYKSYIIVDFSEVGDDVLKIFNDLSSNLDLFFQRLQLVYNTRLYERNSVIIFDEVQMFPKARQMILRCSEKYDYMIFQADRF